MSTTSPKPITTATPTNVSSVTRVLVVDDQEVVRRGLAATFENAPDLVVAGEASDPTDAARILEEESIDIVVLELALDGADGIEWLKNVIARSEDLNVLVFSVLDENLYAQRALQAGARGYVMKSQPLEVLTDAVRRIRSGRVAVSPAMSERLLEQMASGYDVDGSTPIERLSDRELEVFRAIGHGNGTRGIAEDLGLSPKTIETYRENIKAKLDLADANALVHAAVRWVAEQV